MLTQNEAQSLMDNNNNNNNNLFLLSKKILLSTRKNGCWVSDMQCKFYKGSVAVYALIHFLTEYIELQCFMESGALFHSFAASFMLVDVNIFLHRLLLVC